MAAGDLVLTVQTDADNFVAESNATSSAERNNSATLALQTTLAPYMDLVPGSIEVTPAGGFVPGQSVSVAWNTLNLGTRTVDTDWSEELQVVHTETGTIVARVSAAALARSPASA